MGSILIIPPKFPSEVLQDGLTFPSMARGVGANVNQNPTAPTSGSNSLAVYREYLSRPLTLQHSQVQITTLETGKFFYVCFYSYKGLNGGDLLDYSKVDLSATTGGAGILTAFKNKYKLLSGKPYWFALGTDSIGTARVTGNNYDSFQARWLSGIATNLISGGVPPLSLGAVSLNINGSGPISGVLNS